MTDDEIEEFIEEMDHIGDHWEADDVRRVYGEMTKEEALESRNRDMQFFFDAIDILINHTGKD